MTDYARLLFNKFAEYNEVLHHNGQSYFIYNGFKFAKLSGEQYKVYNTHTHHYTEIPDALLLRLLYDVDSIKGYADRIKRLWECDTIDDFTNEYKRL